MRNEQLVSVLMSIYKENVPVVSQAIDSIRKQTYQNLEIVVMLDYPEHEAMKAYLHQLGEEENRLKYHINERNMGLLESLNLGVKLCHGDYICRMDADDFARFDRIEKQMTYIEEKGLDLVGSYIQPVSQDGNPQGKIRSFPSQHRYLCQYLKYANAIPHPTWLVRKSVYEKLKGYRNILYAEDYDFLIRVYLNGYKMGVLPETLLRYRINQNGITQRNIATQKITSIYLAKQIFRKQAYTIDEVERFIKKNQLKKDRLEWYYDMGKRWKRGENITIFNKLKVIFNRYNLVEIRQRLACKWILFKDGRDDNC